MLMAGVNSQWLKKTVLQRNLPSKVKEDVKSLLSLPKTAAGNAIYHTIKQEILRIYAPKPSEAYKKALTRTMVGLPSQLGCQIINDICKKPAKLDGCCCDTAAQALWSLQLPASVRAHISNKDFNKSTYKAVFEAADQVYQSSKQVTVATLMTEGGAAALDETLPAFSQQNQPQVAAVTSNRGNRGGGQRGSGRGGRGSGRGGQRQSGKNKNQGSGNNDRGPRHASNPPSECCDRHYRHGGDAWYCLAPTTCPWVSRITPK